MQAPASAAILGARARDVRARRLLVNALLPLLVTAVGLLVFHWVFPYLFSVLVWLWTAEALFAVALAAVWCVGWWAFASGKIKCPACARPFAAKLHLWVPSACQTCGYDVTAPPDARVAGHREG